VTTTRDEWEGIPYKPNEHCNVCKGAGFLHPMEGDRIGYNRIVTCNAPGCLADSVDGKVSREVSQQTFETFIPVNGTEKALQAAKELAYGEAKFVWLAIFGATGNGKSHLCRATVKVVRERGLDVKMVMAADLFSMLREAMSSNRTDEVLRMFKDVLFLVIDDYGVEYGSEWEAAKFDELMTSRYAKALPTMLATNKALKDLPDRVRSRFTDKVMSRAIHNSAPDFRGMKR